MLVRDIVEKPSASPSEPSAQPQPPRPPVAQTGGFPLAAHRSTRPGGGASAFARARKDDATRRAGGLLPGEGRVVESVPQVISPLASAAARATARPGAGTSAGRTAARPADVPPSAVAGPDDDVHMLAVSPGADVVELLKKRRASVEAAAQGIDPPNVLPGAWPGKVHAPALDAPSHDVTKIRAEVDGENRRKVESMSLAERSGEMQDLEERFGADLLSRLRARAAKRGGAAPYPPTEAATSQDARRPSLPSPSDDPHAAPPVRRRSVHFADEKELRPLRTIKPPGPNATPQPKKASPFAEPDELRSKYFPGESADEPKLEWTRATPMAVDGDAGGGARFDLSGAPLSAEAASALPTHLGLHHHGESPDLAGYTLAEIVHLCYSTVASQRITMMGVLAKIILRHRAAVAAPAAGEPEAWVTQCNEQDITAKGIDVSAGVLGSHTRSIGVLVAAVDLLFAALGGNEWTWLDHQIGEEVAHFHPEPLKDGEHTGVAAIPFEDLKPRLVEIFSLDPGGLPTGTLHQLLLILRRAAVAAPEGAEMITPLVIPVVKTHLLYAPWPLNPTLPPNRQALFLLRDVTVSSREAAEALLGQNMYDPLLKFLATIDNHHDEPSQSLAFEVLRIFYALGRYGLASSVATSARELWRQFGTWAAAQSALPEISAGTAAVISAYLDCLRIWTICSIDPHRTTPEHDLTWAQTSALRWADEGIAFARDALDATRWSLLAASLSALMAYVNGAIINGARKGYAERHEVLKALKDMDLVNRLPQGVNEFPRGDQREPFNRTLTQVFRLHNAIRDGTNGSTNLIESPEKERLLWWFAATTQTTRSDAYLRDALLETARRENVLDTGLWATSAFDTILSYQPGDEPLALSLIDDMLRTDWTGTAGAEAIETIGHKDGLQILRPLLHYQVLPELENILGPARPDHLYLKATGTLRPPPLRDENHREAGLPLAHDFVYGPIDELLASGSSSAFALAPRDWDVTETQIVRATLALARIRAAASPAEHRSLTILNCMKVFMLEHGHQEAPNTVAEVFRDDAVAASLTALLDAVSRASDLFPPPSAAPLEGAALRFLGPGVPFFQFYQDLLALFEAISFGDANFARTLVAPLAMTYPVDYRKLFWIEQTGALRSIRLTDGQAPLEAATPAVFFTPLETDRNVLEGYARALVGTVREDASPFLFRVAAHHLAGLFWKGTETERTSARVKLFIVILSAAQDSVLHHLFAHDVESVDGTGTVDQAEVQRRAAVVAQLTGPRGAQRLKAAGF